MKRHGVVGGIYAMNRSLKLSLLLALALGSTQAAALELGQIQVKSALGQPLLAEIPLTSDSPAELRNLSARLASPEDFARAGLAGARPNLPLQFSVADVGGHKVIRITSAVAINDPYLDLLVEVDSDAGRSVREFPILLDPPGGVPAAPSVRAPRSATRHAAASRPAPASSAPAQSPAQPAATGRTATGGQYGPVERGQTLSGIAHQLAPAGVDPSQMLLALKQANPDAFYQDNINALKSGAVLRVPTGQEAQAMSTAAAMAEIRRQNGDWRAGRPTTTTVADAATRAEASSAPGGTAADDRLALVPAKEGGKGAGVQGGSGKGDAALRQDLLRSQEALTSMQQQSAELKSRLKDLQDINDKNTRLLALKDNAIAELQQKLAEARKNAGLPAAAASTPASSAVVTAPAAASTAVATASTAGVSAASSAPATQGSAAAPATVTPTAAPASKPAKPAAKKPVVPAVVEQPWYMQPWAWAAAGGAVLLLILLALLGRRRKPAAPARAPAAAPSLADRFGALPTAPAGSTDPDQDELLDQLAEHPDDIGLHLELVSLYYSRRDIEHFEAAAEAMHAHIVDPQQDEWQDVVAMGEDLVPGHPLFAGSGRADHDEYAPTQDERHEDGALHPFDLDSYAQTDESPAAEAAPARPKVSEYHFDFDLTPVRPGSSATSGHAGTDDTDLDTDTFATGNDIAGPAPAEASDSTSTWQFEEPVNETIGHAAAAGSHELGQFSDDPIDTKLDLARAYMDMGDADGARAMLEEVMNEGTQMQKDSAQRLLDSLA